MNLVKHKPKPKVILMSLYLTNIFLHEISCVTHFLTSTDQKERFSSNTQILFCLVWVSPHSLTPSPQKTHIFSVVILKPYLHLPLPLCLPVWTRRTRWIELFVSRHWQAAGKMIRYDNPNSGAESDKIKIDRNKLKLDLIWFREITMIIQCTI